MRHIKPICTLLFYLMTLGVIAQEIKNIDGKPSYDDTIEYIKSYFNQDVFRSNVNFSTTASSKRGNDLSQPAEFASTVFKIVSIDFTGCLLNIQYTKEFSYSYYYAASLRREPIKRKSTDTIRCTIDFSKVESIGFSGHRESLSSTERAETTVWGFKFHEKGKTKDNVMDLLIATLDADDDVNQLKNLKIYKAFEHLRKLCGAPDPISFD